MRRTLPILLLCLAVAGPALAQGNPLVGTWSAPLFSGGWRGPGQGAMTFIRFAPDGSCRQSFLVPAGTVTYSCSYGLSPDARVLRVVYHDAQPPGLTLGLPLGVPIDTPLQWYGPNLFVAEDQGAPIRFVRQN